MGRNKIRAFTLSEWVVFFSVLGIFAALVIPSCLRHQAHARIEGLLESARLCQEDLPHWVSNADSREPAGSEAGGNGRIEAESPSLGPLVDPAGGID